MHLMRAIERTMSPGDMVVVMWGREGAVLEKDRSGETTLHSKRGVFFTRGKEAAALTYYTTHQDSGIIGTPEAVATHNELVRSGGVAP